MERELRACLVEGNYARYRRALTPAVQRNQEYPQILVEEASTQPRAAMPQNQDPDFTRAVSTPLEYSNRYTVALRMMA